MPATAGSRPLESDPQERCKTSFQPQANVQRLNGGENAQAQWLPKNGGTKVTAITANSVYTVARSVVRLTKENHMPTPTINAAWAIQATIKEIPMNTLIPPETTPSVQTAPNDHQ